MKTRGNKKNNQKGKTKKPLIVGDIVLAQWRGWHFFGNYYPAIIKTILADGMYGVEFENEDNEDEDIIHYDELSKNEIKNFPDDFQYDGPLIRRKSPPEASTPTKCSPLMESTPLNNHPNNTDVATSVASMVAQSASKSKMLKDIASGDAMVMTHDADASDGTLSDIDSDDAKVTTQDSDASEQSLSGLGIEADATIVISSHLANVHGVGDDMLIPRDVMEKVAASLSDFGIEEVMVFGGILPLKFLDCGILEGY